VRKLSDSFIYLPFVTKSEMFQLLGCISNMSSGIPKSYAMAVPRLRIYVALRKSNMNYTMEGVRPPTNFTVDSL